MCKNYNDLFGSNRFITLIPNTIYGPNDNFDIETGHVISSLIARFDEASRLKQTSVTLWGSGKVKREFVYSADLASMCKILLETENISSPVINLGSGDEVTINQLSQKIAKIVGFKGNIFWDKERPDGVPRKLLSSDYARNLGWKPQTKLEEGLMLTYKWFKEKKVRF